MERAFFREAEDGTTVFFPWGLTHRGYRLSGEDARKKASRAASLLIGSTMAIGTWIAYALQPLLESEATGAAEVLRGLVAPAASLGLVLFSYWLWVWRFVESCPESSLQDSREERLREAAEHAGPGKAALVGVVVVALSALVVWLQPHTWWVGLLGIALGIGVVVWSFVLKRAADGSV